MEGKIVFGDDVSLEARVELGNLYCRMCMMKVISEEECCELIRNAGLLPKDGD